MLKTILFTCLVFHAMLFSGTMSFLLYLNGHEDGSAYKDMRIREEETKKKEKEKEEEEAEEEKD